MIPGSIEALNDLPVGAVLCDGSAHLPLRELSVSWRKEFDGSWYHWIGVAKNTEGVLRVVHPTDVVNMANLSRWTIHPATPYVITEDDDLAELDY